MSRATATKPPFWATAKPPQKLAGSWADLVARAGAALPEGSIVPSYNRALSYAVGELLDHAQLGVGVVVSTPAPGKVAVRFCDSDRILLCAHPPTGRAR